LAYSKESGEPGSAHSLETAIRSLGELSRLPRGARQLARRFRSMRAHASEPNYLLVELRRSPNAPTSKHVAEVFAQLRSRDFRLNRVVIIDGWVLARAEAELCELLSAQQVAG
jgi:hypothetical protein